MNTGADAVPDGELLARQYKGDAAGGKVFLGVVPLQRPCRSAREAAPSNRSRRSTECRPILRALSLAFQQLPDPAFRRILWLGIGLSLLVFVVLGVLVGFGLHYIPATRWHWLDDLMAVGGVLGFLVGLWLLFPAVVSMFLGILLDDVADAVERRHYPADPPGTAPSLALSVVLSLKLMGTLVVLNLLVLPLYIVALFIPFLSLAIFLVLNGYLLGREYFELAATRHMSPRDARGLRRRNSGQVFLAGVVIAGLFSVPFLNILAPVVGAAFMMHVYKALPGPRQAR